MEFFSLGELNKYIGELLVKLNDTPFQKLPGSRRSEFERVDKPVLRPLPPYSYSYKEIKRAKVNIDYHTEYKKTRYSVPHNYIGETVEVCADTDIVEIYFREKLIAQHCRTDRGGFVTDLAHMPESHQHHEKWNEERIRSWAAQQGAEVLEWVNGQFCSREHPAQAYRGVPGFAQPLPDLPQKTQRRLRGCEQKRAPEAETGKGTAQKQHGQAAFAQGGEPVSSPGSREHKGAATVQMNLNPRRCFL